MVSIIFVDVLQKIKAVVMQIGTAVRYFMIPLYSDHIVVHFIFTQVVCYICIYCMVKSSDSQVMFFSGCSPFPFLLHLVQML